MNHGDGSGFKVTDRRHSAKEQSARESEKGTANADTGSNRRVVLPEVSFATFVFSLNTSALVHLGELAEPGSCALQQDLALAQHTIDTLAMLREKTLGNLSEEEASLLDHILFDLRMRFVRASPCKGGSES